MSVVAIGELLRTISTYSKEMSPKTNKSKYML